MNFTLANDVATLYLRFVYKNNLAKLEKEQGDVSVLIQDIYNWILANKMEKSTAKKIYDKWVMQR